MGPVGVGGGEGEGDERGDLGVNQPQPFHTKRGRAASGLTSTVHVPGPGSSPRSSLRSWFVERRPSHPRNLGRVSSSVKPAPRVVATINHVSPRRAWNHARLMETL